MSIISKLLEEIWVSRHYARPYFLSFNNFIFWVACIGAVIWEIHGQQCVRVHACFMSDKKIRSFSPLMVSLLCCWLLSWLFLSVFQMYHLQCWAQAQIPQSQTHIAYFHKSTYRKSTILFLCLAKITSELKFPMSVAFAPCWKSTIQT